MNLKSIAFFTVSLIMTLVAGADTSDNFLYVSVIVGNDTDIQRTHGKYGMDRIHLSQIRSRREKEAIISSFSPSGNVYCVCVKVDRVRVVQTVQTASARSNPVKKQRIETRFNYALKKKLHDVLDRFLVSNGHHIETIEFQVDQDLQKSFKSVGLNCCQQGKAHELADVIAWANHGLMSNSQIDEFDFVDEMIRLTTKGA